MHDGAFGPEVGGGLAGVFGGFTGPACVSAGVADGVAPGAWPIEVRASRPQADETRATARTTRMTELRIVLQDRDENARQHTVVEKR
jgi:hypothetical protein